MLYTLLAYSNLLPPQKTDLICLDLTDFEHFTTASAHDRVQQLPS